VSARGRTFVLVAFSVVASISRISRTICIVSLCVLGRLRRHNALCSIESLRASVREIHAHPHLSVHIHLKQGRFAETDSAKGPNAPFASQSSEMSITDRMSVYSLPTALAGLSSSGRVSVSLRSFDARISECRVIESLSPGYSTPWLSTPQSMRKTPPLSSPHLDWPAHGAFAPQPWAGVRVECAQRVGVVGKHA
jgi:hypothetical protein